MTIMYTTGCIIMSLAFALAFYDILLMFERKRKIWLLPILVVIGTMLIISAARTPALDKYYEVDNPHSYQDLFPEAYKEGYGDGYEKAIKSASLIRIDEDSYVISFNGQNHIYVHSTTDANYNN